MNMIHRKTRDFVVPLLCRYLVILEGPHALSFGLTCLVGSCEKSGGIGTIALAFSYVSVHSRVYPIGKRISSDK